MDRLTVRNADGSVRCNLPVNPDVLFPEKSIRKDLLQEILERLADYEDAEEQGRLVRFPVRVGDVLWAFVNYRDKFVYKIVITEIRTKNNGDGFYTQLFGVWKRGRGTGEMTTPILLEDIGKTVFLNRKEAETALAERNGKEILK